MCGRYTLTSPDEVLAELEVAELAFDSVPRFNIAPTQLAPVVLVRADGRVAELHRFGLVPSWAKGLSVGARFLNARCETAATRPAFRDALKKRRCLVATDGFVEWKREGKNRLPRWFRDPTRRSLPLAGVWERWKSRDSKDADWVLSFSILTAPACEPVASIHDRMPIVLSPGDHERWLDPAVPVSDIEDLLATPTIGLSCTAIDRRINNVRNDDPDCVKPAPVQGELFKP